MTEDSEDTPIGDDASLSVKNIKRRDEYEPMAALPSECFSVPPCECFLKMASDKYKIFSKVLKINTTNILGEGNPDLLTFLFQLYFVISKYQESSLKILKDITRCLNISVANSKAAITADILNNWYNNSETTSETDPFIDIYRLITDLLNRVHSLHFPSNVKFTALDAPFDSTTFKSMAVRVYYDTIVAPFEVITIKVPVSAGSTKKKEFSTRKMKSQKFLEELSKFIEHDESCILDLLWREIDIGIIQQADDATREVVVHQQVGPFDITKSESYAVITDLLIYKVNKADCVAKKFNARAYTKKTLTFNYDAKLAEEYKEFIDCETLRDISVTHPTQ